MLRSSHRSLQQTQLICFQVFASPPEQRSSNKKLLTSSQHSRLDAAQHAARARAGAPSDRTYKTLQLASCTSLERDWLHRPVCSPLPETRLTTIPRRTATSPL